MAQISSTLEAVRQKAIRGRGRRAELGGPRSEVGRLLFQPRFW
jgi:hypothetical protein